MSDDTNSAGGNANSKLTKDFNRDQQRDHRIVSLPPEQRKIAEEMKLSAEEGLQREGKTQTRHHDFRVQKVLIQNLEAAIRNPDRPSNVTPDDVIKIAREDAEATVTHREAWHLSRYEQNAMEQLDFYLSRAEQDAGQPSREAEADIER